MYPETDVPPVQITVGRVERIGKDLPRMPEEVAREIESKYDLGPKLAGQLVRSDYLKIFDEIVASSRGIAASFVATVLTESLRSLAREQVPVENIGDEHLKEVFQLVADGSTAKESVVEILRWLADHPEARPQDALDKLNLRMLTRADLESIVTKVLESNRPFVQENGSKAIGRLMNLVMGEVRGRADPRLVNELLRSAIERVPR
jgi:glutamyl-tRNA(Gln) amidotransferase subunit E